MATIAPTLDDERTRRRRGGRRQGRPGGRRKEPQRARSIWPWRTIQKRQKHFSTIKDLGDHIFDSGSVEDAGHFIKAKGVLGNYIRVVGDLETNIVAQFVEDMTLNGPETPAPPQQIPDPASNADAMIKDPVEHILWEAEIRQLAKRRHNFNEGCRKCYVMAWDMWKKLKQLRGFACSGR